MQLDSRIFWQSFQLQMALSDIYLEEAILQGNWWHAGYILQANQKGSVVFPECNISDKRARGKSKQKKIFLTIRIHHSI